MGHNDHIDFELGQLITDLVDEGYLDEKSAGYGIAQKMVHEGRDSLSPKQLGLYEAVVTPLLKRMYDNRVAARNKELMERDD
jgi:hypothetical protein